MCRTFRQLETGVSSRVRQLMSAEDHRSLEQSPSEKASCEPASQLTEDQTLAQLQRPDASAQMLSSIAKQPDALKSRKVVLAIVTHARTPRHIAIPLLRRMFTFDLMQVTLTPAVAADIKRAAEDQILIRIESLPAGEKVSLARRASGRVAAALLQDSDSRVITPALDNPQLTEALVVQALMKATASAGLFVLICEHPKWSQRREVQIALLRSEKTPIEEAQRLTQYFSEECVRQILSEERAAMIFPQRS